MEGVFNARTYVAFMRAAALLFDGVAVAIVNDNAGAPDIRLPVGYCIYCGSTENLTTEHVVPFFMGGTLELPKASCRACAKITGRFEGAVGRGMLQAYRVKNNGPTRRPKERPTHLPLRIVREGVTENLMVLAADHPGTFALPVFEPPRLMTDLIGVHIGRHQAIKTAIVSSVPLEQLVPAGAQGVETGTVHLTAFTRFLAKMAHGFICAEHGRRSFIPLLIPLILGDTDQYADYIGGCVYPAPNDLRFEVALHPYQYRDGSCAYVGCHIALLPYADCPVYDVVVGRLPLVKP